MKILELFWALAKKYFATTLFLITYSKTMNFSLYCTTTDDSPFFKLSPGICRLAHSVEGLRNENFPEKPTRLFLFYLNKGSFTNYVDKFLAFF